MYCTMLVFQLSGAIVLLLNSIKANEERIIKGCFPGSNIVERDDNDMCLIKKEKLQKSAVTVYLNIMAFADLVFGYGIAAWNPSSEVQGFKGMIFVIACSLTVTFWEYCGCFIMSKLKYSKDKEVHYSILQKNGVDTTLTPKDVTSLWSDSEETING